jgi:Mn2+/Fe2+ NRAMP family transporter
LTGLVRGRYGVRWAAFVALLMLVANLGTTLAPPRPRPRLPNRPWGGAIRLGLLLAILGPGLVSGFADNDAGGIAIYSLACSSRGAASDGSSCCS